MAMATESKFLPNSTDRNRAGRGTAAGRHGLTVWLDRQHYRTALNNPSVVAVTPDSVIQASSRVACNERQTFDKTAMVQQIMPASVEAHS